MEERIVCAVCNHEGTRPADPVMPDVAVCSGCSTVLSRNSPAWTEIDPLRWMNLPTQDREMLRRIQDLTDKRRNAEAELKAEPPTPGKRHIQTLVGAVGNLAGVPPEHRGDAQSRLVMILALRVAMGIVRQLTDAGEARHLAGNMVVRILKAHHDWVSAAPGDEEMYANIDMATGSAYLLSYLEHNGDLAAMTTTLQEQHDEVYAIFKRLGGRLEEV